MARKESITIQDILQTAFEMTREEGFSNVTARKVASKAGCSTQPIFRVYKNMDELCQAVYDRTILFFQEFLNQWEKKSNVPFVDLGMACIAFARQEPRLFELLFVLKGNMRKEMYEVLNGSTGKVGREIAKARAAGCPDPGGLFMKMWIFIHGAACMSLTGDYDLEDNETGILLEEAYRAFTA